jgi:hypothetical protein
MGIDIYAKWRGQSQEERDTQSFAWLSNRDGKIGYLGEAYHGEPYATDYFCPEAFEPGGGRIPAEILRERLPHTLELAEEGQRKLYKATDAEVEEVKESYRKFVELCERKERPRK